MRITHNLHFTGFRVEDFTKAAAPAAPGRPFVTIDMDHEDKLSQATLYLYDPAECDELIKAAAKAKRLLTGKPALGAPAAYIAFGDPQPVLEGKAVQRGEHPYPATSPMGRYDRQAHLAWYQKEHAGSDHWPRQPLTDDEALAAIADYEGTGEQM